MKRLHTTTVFFILIFLNTTVFWAQKHPASVLDMRTANGGILSPQLTTTQRDALATDNDSNGLLIYNTDTNKFNFHDGTSWIVLSAGGSSTLVDTDGDTKIQVEESGDEDAIRFDTGGTERMIIRNNGRVGIGTSLPAIDLAIGDTDTGLEQAGDGVLDFYTNNQRRMRIANDGKVGIGPTAPVSRLTVDGETGARPLTVRSANAINGIRLMSDNAAGSANSYITHYNSSGAAQGSLGLWNDGGVRLSTAAGTGNIDFFTGGTRRFRLTTAGNIELGGTTTNGHSRLYVERTFEDDWGYMASFRNTGTGNNTNGIRIGLGVNNPTTSNEFIRFFTNGLTNERGSIEGNGSFGVRYNTSSDRRLKENIRDTETSIETLMGIKVRDYNFIGGNKDEMGFVAQELYEVFPSAVAPGDEGEEVEDVWQVDKSVLVPLLVKSVQELKAENDVLKARIETLERITN